MRFSYSCSLLFQSLAKKLDNGVCVPFVNAQRLHNVSLIIQQLDEWIRTTRVPHFQAGKFVWVISLYKCYNNNTQQMIQDGDVELSRPR